MITTRDNSSVLISKEESIDSLLYLSTPTIKDLCAESGGSLLIFPQSFTDYGDNLGTQHIFSIEGDKLVTGNIMGFIGYKNTTITIRSRFSNDERDYFLHYMLQKVFSLNIFDLDYHSDEEEILDLLVFTFPHFLNKAMRQGLYKEYKNKKYNDGHLKGRIDVKRHILKNYPFAGKIAYENREFAFDNHVTELIRHTIEFIKERKYGQAILSADDETRENVRLILGCTTLYSRQDRNRIIAENLRPVIHPYFNNYYDLQQICLMILTCEELKYGKKDQKIHGILFDGAWLWEEYLNTILQKLKFKHPKNKEHKGRLHLFQAEIGKKNRSCYPDFYKENVVLDAKYKRYENKSVAEINREDLFQVVSYMWILKAYNGGFIFPIRDCDSRFDNRKLMGYDGQITTFGLKVNSTTNNYKDFCSCMQKEENVILRNIESILK